MFFTIIYTDAVHSSIKTSLMHTQALMFSNSSEQCIHVQAIINIILKNSQMEDIVVFTGAVPFAAVLIGVVPFTGGRYSCIDWCNSIHRWKI